MKSLVVIVILLANHDNLEKNYYPVDTEDSCDVVGQRIIKQIAKYKRGRNSKAIAGVSIIKKDIIK